MLLYWAAAGIHLSVLPQLVIHKLCLKEYNITVCGASDFEANMANIHRESVIFSKAADWNTIIFLAVTIPSIFQVVGYGLISDILNKKFLLLLPPAAMTAQSVIYLLGSNFMDTSVRFLVFGAAVTCLYGDLQGATVLAYSYLAAITNTDENRTLRMIILDGCFFIGKATGSYLGGRLLQRFGFITVFSTSLGINVLNFLYIALILPNIKSDNENNTNNTGCCGKLCGDLGFAFRQVPKRVKSFISHLCCSEARKILIPIMFAAFFTNAAILGENVIIVLFLKHTPLNLLPTEIGQYLSLLNIARGVGAIAVALITLKVFKPPDLVLALVGLISIILTHVFMGISKTHMMLYALSPVSICTSLAMSSFRSITTKEVSPNDHGIALSSLSVISYIGLVVMTLSADDLYKMTAAMHPGAAILLLAASTSVAFLITLVLFIIRRFKKNSKRTAGMIEIANPESDPLLADEDEETDEHADMEAIIESK